MKVGFISLGCAKNQVDTEIMIATLKRAGYKIVNKMDRAEIIVINTCGFIDAAKEEAINTIIETGKMKTAGRLQYLLATGCLAQRYGQELLDEMPELDGIVGISHFIEIDQVLQRIQAGERMALVGQPPELFIEKGPRVLTTPPGSAYLKITEGCNNRCSYCAIPLIRGMLRSRPRAEIVHEAHELVEQGVRELVVVGQDTAQYGWDLTGQRDLPILLRELGAVDGLEWIRLMYLHPAHIDAEIIASIAGVDKVLHYLDIPIQHAADPVLKSMNRRHDHRQLQALIHRLRENLAGLVLRTTVMLGYPGETEADFQILFDFVRENEFDWLGAFAFTAEEGTPAHDMAA
ncbi:MAG: 30S ribosomal protein S12 methylthiotransferase RimO, partial [Firmicutes bacterium]|nr:30S ribosomal protein S12 methylthiotransferase RimO [Bacillota bacterium]